MNELLLWLSGVDRDTLRHCERERTKFVAMGGTVITTSAFAAVAATFTVHLYLYAPLFIAIVVGLLWGLAIMNLDRWLLISIRRQKTAARTVMMAVPRVVLALLIGILIAEPIVLRVFEDEITRQAKRDKRDAREESFEEVRQRFVAVPALKARQDALQAGLTGVDRGAALRESPEYRQAAAGLQRLEARAVRARRAALCELDGSCGTTKRGYGPAYDAKNAVAGQLGEQAAAARSQLDAIRNRLLAEEGRQQVKARDFDRQELERVRAQLRELRQDRRGEMREAREDFTPEIGLLDRMEALGNLTSEHPSMLWLRVILFLCILAVDTLPALAKVLMSLGEPSLYEKQQKQLEQSDSDTLALHVAAYRKANEIDAQILIDEAMTRRAAVKEVQDDLLAEAVEGMREAGERFVAAWREAVGGSVDDLVDAELKRTGLRPTKDGDGKGGHSNGAAGRA